MEEDKIELYSEEVEDLLGTPPRKLVRWGITVFFLIICALITLSAVVDYPDKVIAPVQLSTSYPPSPIITRTEGILYLKNDSNGVWVQQNTILGIIENPADEKDVLILEDEIGNIKEYKPAEILNFKPKGKLQLGNLQEIYSEFTTLFESYLLASNASFDIQKIRQLEKQIKNIDVLNSKLIENERLIDTSLKVARERLERKKELSKDTTISRDVYDVANEQYLIALKDKKNNEMEIKKNELLINDINRQITTIKKNIQLEENSSFVALTESIKKLQAGIKSWKENYLLIASVSGFTSFNPSIKSKMYVSKEAEIVMILPKEDSIIGKIDLQMAGAGKVKKGDSVIIKLDAYPYQEYGFLRGRIDTKSAITRENKFYVEVILTKGLETNRGDTLKFQQQIEGRAEIITESKSLLSRIFDQIITALEMVKE